jgi:hypothetical protein
MGEFVEGFGTPSRRLGKRGGSGRGPVDDVKCVVKPWPCRTVEDVKRVPGCDRFREYLS